MLTDAELVKVWNASEKLSPAYRDAFKLLVLTGCRKQEIGGLRWDETDGDEIVLEGERTKNCKPHIVPLPAPARAIVKRRRPTAWHLRLPDRARHAGCQFHEGEGNPRPRVRRHRLGHSRHQAHLCHRLPAAWRCSSR